LKEDAIMQPVVLTLITDYDMRIATVDMLSFMGGGACLVACCNRFSNVATLLLSS
jgi:hypothetical protein